MTKPFVSLAIGSLLTVLLFSSANAQDVPAQFKIWGRQAIESKALPDAGMDRDSSQALKASDEERQQGFFIFSRSCSDYVAIRYTACGRPVFDVLVIMVVGCGTG